MMANRRIAILVALVAVAALFRLLPHPPNFVPVAAMALFAGATFSDTRFAYLVPLAAMFLSDLILGLHAGMPVVYVSLAITVWIGTHLQGRARILRVGGAAVAGSVVFFVLTNFGVWLSSGMYPLSLEGLIACYVAAIPFFHNTLAGALFYSAVLFGAFAWLERRHPALRTDERHPA